MKYKKNISLSIVLIATMIAGGLYLLSPDSSHPAEAAVSNWHKGVSIDPRSPEDFGSETFRESLRNAKNIGANAVSLIIPYYQTTSTSHDMAPGWNTPTDTALISAITYAHSLGMRVDIKPHLQISSDPGAWRATINAADRDSWYLAYENMLKHYAIIAEEHNVEGLIIGTELINMASSWIGSDNTARWSKIIDNLRPIYPGAISYSANWGSSGWYDEKNFIKFWDKLDYIAISAYLPLSTNPSYTIDELKATWANWDAQQIKVLADTYDKSVVFSEVGYRSVDGAMARPARWQNSAGVDLQEQVDGFRALFEYWGSVPHFNGISIWGWSSDPAYGGHDNNDYTPQHKPAEEYIRQWFSGFITATPAPSPSLTPLPNPILSGETKINPVSVPPNMAATISVDITNSSSYNASNLLVDIEVYNQNGAKVHQYAPGGIFINGNSTQHFETEFSSSEEGEFRVKLGVFTSDWQTNYYWNDNAGILNIARNLPPAPTPKPTPDNATIDIWWPTQDSLVTGIQPFKGLLQGWDLSQYHMYWQVDGDRLNIMGDSNVDWPHKEAMVDLSGWNWNDQGTYHLNFIVKDLGGGMLSQKSVDIRTK